MTRILYIFLLIVILILPSCSGESSSDNNHITETTEKEEKEEKVVITESDPIIGERIDGPANVRDTVNGKKLFELYDNVLVETTQSEDEWLQIGLFVKLSKQEERDFIILPNTKLKSVEGNVIGKTSDTVDVWMSDGNSGLIAAYTHIGNIKNKTVPELILAKSIEKNEITKNELNQFIEDFNFEYSDSDENSDLKEYFIYESIVVDPSPRDRITLIFNNKEELIAVVHSRPLNTSRNETFKLVRGHSLTVTSDLSEKEIKEIIDERVHFYNSVD